MLGKTLKALLFTLISLIYMSSFAVVKIGVLLPLTGPLAAAGDLVKGVLR